MKKIPKLKINIRNQADDTAEIDIDGEIGWVNENGEWNTAANIKDKLNEISDLDVSTIKVNINSLGGFVHDGLAIHDALAQHEAQIETHVTGTTASAATIIAQAGDKRFMSDNSLYLIHKAWSLTIGNANDMLAQAEDLETIDERIVNIYTKRSGKSETDIQELMNANDGAGKWIDADEAMEFGLIDEVFEPMKAAAAVDMDMFKAMGVPVPEGMEQSDSVTFSSDSATFTFSNNYANEIEELKNEIEQLKSTLQENDSTESDDMVPEGAMLEKARNREAELLLT